MWLPSVQNEMTSCDPAAVFLLICKILLFYSGLRCCMFYLQELAKSISRLHMLLFVCFMPDVMHASFQFLDLHLLLFCAFICWEFFFS